MEAIEKTNLRNIMQDYKKLDAVGKARVEGVIFGLLSSKGEQKNIKAS